MRDSIRPQGRRAGRPAGAMALASLLLAATATAAPPPDPPSAVARLAGEWAALGDAVAARNAAAGRTARLGADVIPALADAAAAGPGSWTALARQVDEVLVAAGASAVERVRLRCALVDALPTLNPPSRAVPNAAPARAGHSGDLRDALLPVPPESAR